MPRYVALLRAINVGRRQLPMADLRALAAGLGLADAQTYIASGNLVFAADGAEAEAALNDRLEQAIAARFGFPVDVVLRSAAHWAVHAAANPFPDAQARLLHLGVTRRPLLPDAAERIRDRAQAGERVAEAGGALWIDYQGGVARTKLTPAFLDKAAGSPLTTRNWNTVQVLRGMLAG